MSAFQIRPSYELFVKLRRSLVAGVDSGSIRPGQKQVVDGSKSNNADRLPSIYDFHGPPLFTMTND